MKKLPARSFAFPTLVLLFITMMLGIIACKDQSEKSSSKNETPTEKDGKVSTGNYNYLYCTKQEFSALKTFPGNPPPKREGRGTLMLKYCIADSGLTLHGWTYKYHNDTIFTPTPNLKLLIGKDTSVTYNVGSYLGDFVVSNADVKKVQALIAGNPNYSHVVFVPRYSANTNLQIDYDIYLSSSAPTLLLPKPTIMMLKTEAEGRPIPPGGGQSLEE